MKKGWLGLIVLMVAFAVVAAGCGSKTNNTENSPSNTNTGKANSDTGTANGDTGNAKADDVREIKHAMGTTKLTGTPKRVVILTNEGTEALLALGVKPVGAAESFEGDPWYPHIKDQMEGVQDVGGESQPNIELIASLKPDLIIGNKMRQEKVYDQLNAIAPTVMAETLRGEWQANFKLYAEALNKKAEGDQLLADFDKKIADAKATLGDKLQQKVSIVRFMPDKTRIYYNETFSGMVLDKLGFARPAAQSKDGFADDVNKDRIPDMDGDILFYFMYNPDGSDATQKVADEWMNDPLWKNLSVAKKNNVHMVDDAIWNTSGGIISANKMVDELLTYFK
ncbi:ABC transporter substrate-binding protein [Paenibacillus sacheonensis]|uniref:ABC transporter substrate-binding protein n=1 Tax=Paenibacillus sacheonensis TaxID=742054 RepID=A0A7X4YR95_9BACL|nr:iron-siderophore ABC transporter substrate-binding protein [Paenibacillus sacheonensis]MBM7565123.1 iron complex transport system substrate-binding protein [Paenibacillus sacheonensis]NBC70094.1 ABC transporter substrate-binding protein [Paenibacillus sacheonensis]